MSVRGVAHPRGDAVTSVRRHKTQLQAGVVCAAHLSATIITAFPESIHIHHEPQHAKMSSNKEEEQQFTIQ